MESDAEKRQLALNLHSVANALREAIQCCQEVQAETQKNYTRSTPEYMQSVTLLTIAVQDLIVAVKHLAATHGELPDLS